MYTNSVHTPHCPTQVQPLHAWLLAPVKHYMSRYCHAVLVICQWQSFQECVVHTQLANITAFQECHVHT